MKGKVTGPAPKHLSPGGRWSCLSDRPGLKGVWPQIPARWGSRLDLTLHKSQHQDEPRTRKKMLCHTQCGACKWHSPGSKLSSSYRGLHLLKDKAKFHRSHWESSWSIRAGMREGGQAPGWRALAELQFLRLGIRSLMICRARWSFWHDFILFFVKCSVATTLNSHNNLIK